MGKLANADDLAGYLQACAKSLAPDVPPIEGDQLCSDLTIAIGPHSSTLLSLDDNKRRTVVTHAAIRIAQAYRFYHFEQADQFFYWPLDLYFILELAAEGYASAAAASVVRQHADFNLQAKRHDIIIATVAPSYLHAPGHFDLITAVADVTRAVDLLPTSEKEIVQRRFFRAYRPTTGSGDARSSDLNQIFRRIVHNLNRTSSPLRREERRRLQHAEH